MGYGTIQEGKTTAAGMLFRSVVLNFGIENTWKNPVKWNDLDMNYNMHKIFTAWEEKFKIEWLCIEKNLTNAYKNDHKRKVLLWNFQNIEYHSFQWLSSILISREVFGAESLARIYFGSVIPLHQYGWTCKLIFAIIPS